MAEPPSLEKASPDKALSSSKTNRDLSPAKRWAFKLLAVVLSLLVSFFCLEIALRVWGPKYYQFSNRSGVYYSNPRGYFDVLAKEGDQLLYGIRIELVDVNSRFQRLPEDTRGDEDFVAFFFRKNTILGLGDSFTLGQGVRYEDTYLRRLEKRLAKDGTPIWINNTSFASYDLEEICDVYAAESARQYYPLVIYGFVLNDFGMPGISEVVGPDYIDINNGGNEYSRWRGRLATVNFIGHTIETIRLDRVTRRIYLDAFKGDNARKHFQLLADLNHRIDSNGSKLLIVLFPLLYEFDHYPFQEIHNKIAHFCRQEDIPLLDLLGAFSKHKAEELWVHPMDHHPNDIAHEITAEELHAFLKREGLLELLRPEADTAS